MVPATEFLDIFSIYDLALQNRNNEKRIQIFYRFFVLNFFPYESTQKGIFRKK